MFSIVETEAAIIHMIYDLYEREKSLVTVAKTINASGLKTKRGAAWSPVSLNTILRSPFYIGTYRYNYRDEAQTGNSGGDFKPEGDWILIEDHHDPIIERDQWERVAEILTGNRRIDGGLDSYNRKNIHIFAGLLKCGVCGSRMTAQPDRARNGGWRPSIYFCSHRRKFNGCMNKSVSDITLGPFALNYIANMMKAERSFGATTSVEVLERKLLRGKALADVEHIEGVGLQELYDILRRGKIPEVSYEIPEQQNKPEQEHPQELDLLIAEKRRSERALARLQNLFLYGEDVIAEKDYLIERKRMTDELSAIDSRIETLEKDRVSQITMTDDDFITKASYFILTQGLTEKRDVDYEKLVRTIDPRIVKDFLNSIVQNFCIKDGRIDSIRFKNGMEHRFLYKDEEE